MIQHYSDLIVWQDALELTAQIYTVSRTFPRQESYGITSQIRRAAVSVVANVAEGHGRSHRGEYAHHVSIAKGSLMEVEALVAIACKLGFCDSAEVVEIRTRCTSVGKMLSKLHSRLARK